MFFDPQCKPEVKADPFSLDSLIAWLEKQPASKEYSYTRPTECLVAQYLLAMGFTNFSDHYLTSAEVEKLGWTPIAQGDERSWTFGAALERARALRQ